MIPPRTLNDVLADHAERVPHLRRGGAVGAANAIEDVLSEVRRAAPEFLTWHDLTGAALLSGKPPGYFRSRFKGWQARGLARCVRRGHLEFLECVIPKQEGVADLVRDAEATAAADARQEAA